MLEQPFSQEDEEKYSEYFVNFNYKLSDFQKKSIKAIVDGNHSLVCCGTGNGKTNSGEFAIRHFTSLGKKVIYTVPIRSLGNQKFYDFSLKFPDITFGLLTGEVKTFPNAQVLIMTQEILTNYLFVSSENNESRHLTFQIDIKNELGAVVIDECHYIMDNNRGHAWESAILMLPQNVQLIMLSATLDNPKKLASWVEKRHSADDKIVVISSTIKRIIPLNHYAYLTTTEAIFKKIKDKDAQKEIRDVTNKLLLLKNENNQFNNCSLDIIRKIKKTHDNNQVYIKRQLVLNNLSKHLVENEMLPAIVYCFSRKNVEIFAKDITTNLLEFDSKIPYTIRREAEHILRKLPNYEEYLKLPEYEILMNLLEKGVGFHHSGMVSILREIVELFISKGHIKLLFCTDSFSVGLNCPIKTTVFTGIRKFDGNNEQFLEPHLYAQCSGRAGRRGIDIIGNVIHCNNLFETPTDTVYKEILCGKPQKLISKFRISFNTILNIMNNGLDNIKDFIKFISKSMIHDELIIQSNSLNKEIDTMRCILKSMEMGIGIMRTPLCVVSEYLECLHIISTTHNKKKKACQRKLNDILFEYKYCEEDTKQYIDYTLYEKMVTCKSGEMKRNDEYIETHIKSICTILIQEKFITYDLNLDKYKFTENGKIASQFSELHPLVFTEYLDVIENLSIKQLVGFLSCFTDIRVKADYVQTTTMHIQDNIVKELLNSMSISYRKYEDYESSYDIQSNLGQNDIIYDIYNETQSWCDLKDEESCKVLINQLLQDKNISLGDFSKAILKISTISKELMNVCENENRIKLLSNLYTIDELLLKHICTNQSLYI